MADEPLDELAGVVRASGLIPVGTRGVVLVSGGPDSACAVAGVAAVAGAGAVSALHLDYGLRPDSGLDRETCESLCAGLNVPLTVERPALDGGNLQAAAREARYAAAERLAERTGADWIATGHTRTDLAETVLYRLAASPGSRALLGLPARQGRVVRPLLALGRARVRELAQEARLPFRDDSSNLDPRFARNRIRADVLPALRDLNPAAEENVARTQAELAEEADVLSRLAEETLDAAGAGAGALAVRAEALLAIEPGLARLALRALAERAARRELPLGRDRAAQILRLAATPEGGTIELGGGIQAVCEAGMIRLSAAEADPPAPSVLTVPGHCRFGEWELEAELGDGPIAPSGPERATLDADTLGGELMVRAWRDGDRMRPLGLAGTKSLQDLFTDGRVPRSLRHSLPLVLSGERIAWVAGVAVSEEFKLTPEARRVAVLSARVGEKRPDF